MQAYGKQSILVLFFALFSLHSINAAEKSYQPQQPFLSSDNLHHFDFKNPIVWTLAATGVSAIGLARAYYALEARVAANTVHRWMICTCVCSGLTLILLCASLYEKQPKRTNTLR